MMSIMTENTPFLFSKSLCARLAEGPVYCLGRAGMDLYPEPAGIITEQAEHAPRAGPTPTPTKINAGKAMAASCAEARAGGQAAATASASGDPEQRTDGQAWKGSTLDGLTAVPKAGRTVAMVALAGRRLQRRSPSGAARWRQQYQQ